MTARSTPVLAEEPVVAPERASRVVRRLMWSWVAVVVVFFSIPSSKLVGYILPACAPLAFLIADAAHDAWNRRTASVWWTRSAVAAAVLCLAIVGVVLAVDRSSNAAIARAYDAQSRPGEPLVMLDDYFYDVPLLAASRGTVPIVGDWTGPTVGSRDNWQKEVVDAAAFAPDKGASVLVDVARFPHMLCDAPVHWLIAAPKPAGRHAWLAAIAPIATSKRASLWRIDRAVPSVAAALGCTDSPAHRSP